MKHIKITVTEEVEEKILFKHHIGIDELKTSLIDGKPKFLRLRDNTYMAIAHHYRYLTIIFDYRDDRALVRTAYPSSPSQINRYQKK